MKASEPFFYFLIDLMSASLETIAATGKDNANECISKSLCFRETN